MDKIGIVFILSLCTAHVRRLRRQTLPSQHIQVHSIQSNVLLDKYITVISSNSRLDLTEKEVNGSIWSAHSVVTFDSYDTFVNCSAQMAESYLNIKNSANIYAQGNDVNFSMRTNRTQDGHSIIIHNLVGNTNVSVDYNDIRVQAMNGECVGVEITTSSSRKNEKSLSFTTHSIADGVRELILIAEASFYRIRVCFVGSTILVEFSDKIIQIDNEHDLIDVYNDRYTITAKMNTSFYDLSQTKDEIIIKCPEEDVMLRVLPSGVNVYVNQLSKLQIDRGGGEISLGKDVLNADVVMVTSLKSELNLSDTGQVTADFSNSEIAVQTPVQNVRMTSVQHVIRIEGGTPFLTINSGRVCIEVKANHGVPQIDAYLPTFVVPTDQFADIGPDKAIAPATRTPSVILPSIPRSELLNHSSFHSNKTDHCAGCGYHIKKVSTTKLPTKIVPTFPLFIKTSTVISPALPTRTTSSDHSTTIEIDVSSASVSTEQSLFISDAALSSNSATQNTVITSTDELSNSIDDARSSLANIDDFSTTVMTSSGTDHSDSIATNEINEFATSDSIAASPIDVIAASDHIAATSAKGTNISGSTSTVSLTDSTSPMTENSQSSHTLDQFVIGQYGDVTSTAQSLQNDTQLEDTAISTTSSEILSLAPTAIFDESHQLHTDSTTTLSINASSDDVIYSSGIGDTSVISSTSSSTIITSTAPQDQFESGVGGSWETETLFPSQIETPPTTKPSILILKMKVPSELDLQSFDLTRNLTTSLSDVVRESVQRVKREKRSPLERRHESLVKVHRIERLGNSMSVIFSINETDVDSNIVENDLYSLDLNYLARFLAFPVLSTISKTNTNGYHYFIVVGIVVLLSSMVFFCIVFRSTVKEKAKTFSVSINRFFTTCRLPTEQRVTSITIMTDETLTP